MQSLLKNNKTSHPISKKGTQINIEDDAYNKYFEKFKTKKFMSDPDATNFALGDVLSQDNKSISFASRTLNDHEILSDRQLLV